MRCLLVEKRLSAFEEPVGQPGCIVLSLDVVEWATDAFGAGAKEGSFLVAGFHSTR